MLLPSRAICMGHGRERRFRVRAQIQRTICVVVVSSLNVLRREPRYFTFLPPDGFAFRSKLAQAHAACFILRRIPVREPCRASERETIRLKPNAAFASKYKSPRRAPFHIINPTPLVRCFCLFISLPPRAPAPRCHRTLGHRGKTEGDDRSLAFFL
jgi:hypothetical protein